MPRDILQSVKQLPYNIKKSLSEGFRTRVNIINDGIKYWEFWALTALSVGIMIFMACIVMPVFILQDESVGVPEVQTIDYSYSYTTSDGTEGRLEISCRPTRNYVVTDSSLDCTSYAYEGGPLSVPTIGVLSNRSAIITFAEFQWVSPQSGNGTKQYRALYFGNSAYNGTFVSTPSTSFRIPTPSISGDYYLSIDPPEELVRESNSRNGVTVYSNSEVADFEYRETIAPLERLVIIGLLITLLRFWISISDRLVKRIE